VQKKLPSWVHQKPIGRVLVKNQAKVIALTFDDGPWPVYTGQILDILKREQVHATFFMIGRNISHWPALARRVAAEGHAIGNHTWNHPSRPRGVRAEIQRTDAELKQTVGFTPNLFRPPYGIVRNGLAAYARSEGKAVVLWSADSEDWNHASSGAIYSTIMRQSGPGGIALMHDGGGNRAATVAALPNIIASLRARGYRFATVPELLAMHEPPPSQKRSVAQSKSAMVKKPVSPPKKSTPTGRSMIASPPAPVPKTPAVRATLKPTPKPTPGTSPVLSKPRKLKEPATPAKAGESRATGPSRALPRDLSPTPRPHRSPTLAPEHKPKVPSPQTPR